MNPQTSHSPLPVTLLAGFLGAGKTTLLNRIIRADLGQRIAVMVNDFGSINIDAALVDSVHGQAVSMSNGCVCCDIGADLRGSLLAVLCGKPTPERILIEASGVADPLRAAATFRLPELRDRLQLDGVITLVDAEHARDSRFDAQLIHDQIVAADIIVLNKVDLVNAARSATLYRWIEMENPSARILEAVRADVPLPLLLGTGGAWQADGVSSHLHSHAGQYGTWSYRAEHPVDLSRTLTALRSLPTGIVRAKGILWLADAPGLRLAVQVVGRRISTSIEGPWNGKTPETRLVFIGKPGALDDAWLTRLDP